MAGCRALSRTLQLLLRSPATLQLDRAAAVSALQGWLVHTGAVHRHLPSGSLRSFASASGAGDGDGHDDGGSWDALLAAWTLASLHSSLCITQLAYA